MNEISVSEAEIDELYERLNREAEAAGYHLNPDVEATRDLVRGLLTNIKRYGYQNCPCRLASGDNHEDLDIICPCDYRDPDLEDYDMCYCALYVSGAIKSGEKEAAPIPERRPARQERAQIKAEAETSGATGGAPGAATGGKELSKPVWRCRVCGYLCGRDEPPETCPICHAKKERFERFM